VSNFGTFTIEALCCVARFHFSLFQSPLKNRHVVCKLAHKLAPPTTKWLGVRFKVGGAYLNFKNELEIEKIT